MVVNYNSRRQLSKMIPVLDLIKKTKSDKMQDVLPYLNEDVQETICTLIGNCLRNKTISTKKRINLSKKLAHKKNLLRYLSNPKVPIEKRRQKLPQAGGVIGTILSVALPLLASYIASKVKSRKNK